MKHDLSDRGGGGVSDHLLMQKAASVKLIFGGESQPERNTESVS